MYPSSLKIRAISALIFEYGMSTSGFCARTPLRTRARKSAIGSVTVLIKKSGGLRGGLLCPIAKRHAHFAQQRFSFLVRSRRGDDCNIKSDVALDFVEFYFGENRLVGNTKRVIAVLVEAARRYTAEIANTRQRSLDETLKEFVHSLAAQRDLCSDGLIFAQFKIGDAFLRQRLHRSLSGNQRKLRFGFFQRLLNVGLRADRSVNHDLLDLWDLMDVFVAVEFLQRRYDVLFIVTTKFVFHITDVPLFAC